MKNKTLITIAVVGMMLLADSLDAQPEDWRNVRNGSFIATNGYCDQPYVVVLKDRKWLVVYTTGASGEGSGGQHIVSSISTDQGKTWTTPVPIEKPGPEAASWAMPYLTRYGRVYVFYDYNGDKIHELGRRKNIRADMLGWYCYKYSDDEGTTWSQRYRLPVANKLVDLHNDWRGTVQIQWGIGKPVNVDKGMMFSFAKIGKYMLDDSEGWFFRCDNINTQKDPRKLGWKLLPDGEKGLKNPALGPINAEQNIFQMNDGSIYCMERTISGHPAEAYSRDGGKSWTLPQVPKYVNGVALKNPRACPRIWKCKNGKYLFWYHNNGGWNFNSRNPAWVSGGIEKYGKIVWGQPEILLYEDDQQKRMSYPDLIEQDGRYWVTETNKEEAKCNEVPAAFFEKLWSQLTTHDLATTGLVGQWNAQELTQPSIGVPAADYTKGLTIDCILNLGDLTAGQEIAIFRGEGGRRIELQTADYGSVAITITDSTHNDTWNSDPGLIPAYGEHEITVILDNGPKIIQFVVDGTVCNGRDFRQFGWTRFQSGLADLNLSSFSMGKLADGQIRPAGKVSLLRIYNRPLMNTEAIGNYRNFLK